MFRRQQFPLFMFGFSGIGKAKGGVQGRKAVRLWATIGIAVWLATLSVAINGFMRWDTTPGILAGEPAVSAPVRTDGQWQIVLVAHTECPCTRATFVNLDKLLSRYRGRLVCKVVFCGPGVGSSSTSQNVLIAKRLPNTELEFMSEAEVLSQYRSTTSGQAFLYSPQGELKFRGGLTISRGHEGDSTATNALGEWIEGRKGCDAFPVYGCPLQTEVTPQ